MKNAAKVVGTFAENAAKVVGTFAKSAQNTLDEPLHVGGGVALVEGQGEQGTGQSVFGFIGRGGSYDFGPIKGEGHSGIYQLISQARYAADQGVAHGGKSGVRR